MARKSRPKIQKRLEPDAKFIELSLVHAELVDRVCQFNHNIPSDIARTSTNITECVFREAQEIAKIAKSVSEGFGIKPPRGVVWDFSPLSYEKFKAEERKIENALQELPDSVFAPLIPEPPVLYADTEPGTIVRQGAPAADTSATSGTRKWLAKLFAALGLKEVYTSFLEVLEAEFPNLLKDIGKAITGKNWGLLKQFLKLLLEFIMSKPFLKKLALKIGESAAAKLIGKILAKFLPFVGWALVIGGFVWAIVEQFL